MAVKALFGLTVSQLKQPQMLSSPLWTCLTCGSGSFIHVLISSLMPSRCCFFRILSIFHGRLHLEGCSELSIPPLLGAEHLLFMETFLVCLVSIDNARGKINLQRVILIVTGDCGPKVVPVILNVGFSLGPHDVS